ncbi:MAG: lamin tail domain-containing protein [Candidatus Methanofastidiosia archaeon]
MKNSHKFIPFIFMVLLFSSFFFPVDVEAESNTVVINEIMQNPSAVSDSKGEWFELYNTTSDDINLNGWTIYDERNDSFVIDVDIVIPAQGYLVFGRNGDETTNGGVKVDYVYKGMYLSNTFDNLILLDENNVEIDRVEYGGERDFPSSSGKSMELKNPFYDNNVGTNWGICTVEYGLGDMGTPCAKNSVYIEEDCNKNPDVPINAIFKVFTFQANKELMAIEERLDIIYYQIEQAKAAGFDMTQLLEYSSLAIENYEIAKSRIENGDPLRSKPYMSKACEYLDICGKLCIVENPSAKILFCDNKKQYYTFDKAKTLVSLLEERGIEVDDFCKGEITYEKLVNYNIVIITNPQEKFNDEEIDILLSYLQEGGKIILTGQYYKYINPGELNRISLPFGIRFTSTEVVDYVNNTGAFYYPLITDFNMGTGMFEKIREVHYANGCWLDVKEGTPLMWGSKDSYVVDKNANIVLEVGSYPCVAALSSDGSIVCISSSTILTTSIHRGDNAELIIAIIDFLLG